jgi:hypothetical protein
MRLNPPPGRTPISTIGGWSRTHPWRAIILWLLFVAATISVLRATGSKTLQRRGR